VDWAALAQQWIQMKETLPSDQIPPAPPPPPIGDKNSAEKKKDLDVEGGEAPMDMDTKDDHDNSNSSNTQTGGRKENRNILFCECMNMEYDCMDPY
jgi:hypothetical protein